MNPAQVDPTTQTRIAASRAASSTENIPQNTRWEIDAKPQLPTATRKPCVHPTTKLATLFPARDFITGHHFELAECAECGFAVTTPQPTGEETASYYPDGYYGAAEQRRFPRIVETLQNALYTLRVREVE